MEEGKLEMQADAQLSLNELGIHIDAEDPYAVGDLPHEVEEIGQHIVDTCADLCAVTMREESNGEMRDDRELIGDWNEPAVDEERSVSHFIFVGFIAIPFFHMGKIELIAQVDAVMVKPVTGIDETADRKAFESNLPVIFIFITIVSVSVRTPKSKVESGFRD